MKNNYFKAIEQLSDGFSFDVKDIIKQLAFNKQGLIPVITQDVTSRQVLMLAWMNKDALEQTLSTKAMTYWSRSREQLWVKGETSGHRQALKSMSFDCDGDSILCLVQQEGAACHTNRHNCFYLKVDADQRRVHISGS